MDARSRRMEVLREIPPLLPRFLHRRRVGLPAVGQMLEETGLERSVLFSLLHLHNLQGSYGGDPVSEAQIRAYDPYSTIDNSAALLSAAAQAGFVRCDNAGSFALAPAGERMVTRLHYSGREYVARARPLPEGELLRLAQELERALDAIVNDDVLSPRPGSHLAMYRTLDVGRQQPAPVRIEQVILELWGARDDAHMRAWREAGLEGPAVAVLSRLWTGEAHTPEELQKAFSGQLGPEDVESSLAFLVEKEYVARNDLIALTPAGVLVREDIERETDRVYFAPWPQTLEEAEWVRDHLRALVEKWPTPPRSS